MKFKFILISLIIFFNSQFSYGNIGDTPEQSDKKYGPPYCTDTETEARSYHYGKYTILVDFENGIACKIIYGKRDGSDCSPKEVQTILQDNVSGKKLDIYRKVGLNPWKWITKDRQIVITHHLKGVFISKANELDQKFDSNIIIDEPEVTKKTRKITTFRLVEDRKLSKDLSIIWFFYGSELLTQITCNDIFKEFKDKEPVLTLHIKDNLLIPTFEEELEARQVLVDNWKKEKAKNSELKDKYLDELLLVDKAGLMREYVWTYLIKPSWTKEPEKLDLKKFAEWDKKNLKNHKVETHGYIKVIKKITGPGNECNPYEKVDFK